ncbi:MAG: hypothetical protein Kilf2KO_20460 [Rhodospirillales bacterium]
MRWVQPKNVDCLYLLREMVRGLTALMAGDADRSYSTVVFQGDEAGYRPATWQFELESVEPLLQVQDFEACRASVESLEPRAVNSPGFRGPENLQGVGALIGKMQWHFDPDRHVVSFTFGEPLEPWPSPIGVRTAEGLPQTDLESGNAPAASQNKVPCIPGSVGCNGENGVGALSGSGQGRDLAVLGGGLFGALCLGLGLGWLMLRHAHRGLFAAMRRDVFEEAAAMQRSYSDHYAQLLQELIDQMGSLASSFSRVEERLSQVASERQNDPPTEPETDIDAPGATPAQEIAPVMPDEPLEPEWRKGVLEDLWERRSLASIGDDRSPSSLVQDYNLWLAEGRSLEDFAAERGFFSVVAERAVEAGGGAIVLHPRGEGRGTDLFVLPLSSVTAVGFPGARLFAESRGSQALRARVKPFFRVDIGESVRPRLTKPCVLEEQEDTGCVLRDPGVMTAPR